MSADPSQANSTGTSWLGIPDRIDIFGQQVEPFTIIVTVLVIVAGFALARFARIITTKYIGSKLPADARKNLGRTTYYAIIAIALLSALGISGINLSGLFLAGGFAGIIIGFATQSLFSNLISGIFLQLDKPMKVGDPVLITGKLPDVAGVVVEITALSSRFRMFDGTYARLPNTEVFSSEIRNFSSAAARRVEISVRIAYPEDSAKVLEIIRKNLDETPLVLVEPGPNVYVNQLSDSSVDVNVWCWTPFSVWFDTRMLIAQQVKQELERNGIEIAFPQRVIHITDSKNEKAGSPVSRSKKIA